VSDLTHPDAFLRLARAEHILRRVLHRDPSADEVGQLLEADPHDVVSAQAASFAHRLRRARLDRAQTIRDLAAAASVDASTLSKLESGRHLPSKRVSAALEAALSLQLGSLQPQLHGRQRIERESETAVQLVEVSKDLITYLAADPQRLHSLSPRKFEELVAELLRDMGCQVRLTPESRDGGRDVLATMGSPLGELLAIVECKRYAAHRKVGVAIVERFLWTTESRDRASLGILATTSSFTMNARELERSHRWRLALRDHDSLVEWLANYGRWSALSNTQLWLPKAIARDADRRS
jgi:transcriptional regulator with XRE-family HTH domain